VPRELVPESGSLQVDFVISNPASPQQMGTGTDIRTLGLNVGQVFLESVSYGMPETHLPGALKLLWLRLS
jgi:hypothetical protein